jgi:hypothetical protein
MRRLANFAHAIGIVPVSATELVRHLAIRSRLRVTARSGESATISITSPTAVDGLTVLIANVVEPEVWISGRQVRGKLVQRYGVKAWGVQVDLDAKLPTTLDIDGATSIAA